MCGHCQAFRVWDTEWQYLWAQEGWSVLADQGLTSYDGFLDRAEVYLRVLALGCLYRDFCDIVADEHHDREDWMWIDEVGLQADVFHPLALGMMIGTDGESRMIEAEKLPEDGYYQSIIEPLVDQQRRPVYDALLAAYGSADVLWGMLALTLQRDPLDWAMREPDSDPLSEVLNRGAPEDVAGYSWVVEGCEVIRQSWD
jgi:hypothetical protein